MRIMILAPLVVLLTLACGLSAVADAKFISLDGFPTRNWIDVGPEGEQVYLSGTDYLVIDTQGQLVKKVAFSPWGTSPIAFSPLPDGWFLAGVRGLSGRIDLHRPDGTVAKTLVRIGNTEKQPHGDPNWANPDGMTVDLPNKRIFLLDSTEPGREPTPNWSRIIVYDLEGNYLNDIGRYDAKAANAAEIDHLRTTYASIAVDPARKIVYVTANRPRELRAFSYDGALLNSNKAYGALAVLADGRIAVAEGRVINLYNPDLTLESSLNFPPGVDVGARDLAADAKGNLYAILNDPSVIYARWSENLQNVDVFRNQYLKLNVTFPNGFATAGTPFSLKVNAMGNPQPDARPWQVMARPSDGRDLRWRLLNHTLQDDTLQVISPDDMDGLYEVAVRYGEGPITWADRKNDPFLQRTMAFLPAGATRSLTVQCANGRSAFQQGESIPLHIIARQQAVEPVAVTLTLEGQGQVISTTALTVDRNLSLHIPAQTTRRLAPGRYRVTPHAVDYQCYALTLDIATEMPDSPMQRILYAEFGGGGSVTSTELADNAERMASVRDYALAMARLGFTRETERTASTALNVGPRAWRYGWSPVTLTAPGFAPPEYYQFPSGEAWGQEYYLDQAVKYGLKVDSQLLGHCAGTPVHEQSLNRDSAALQRYTQWMLKYPSFYGFNYNDEMFFRSYGWNPDEEEGLKQLIADKFEGKPLADAYTYALEQLYDRYNSAVRQVWPGARLTTTPMWQFPAVDGNYIPTIYKGMTETYGHYMTEGQHVPWYPAHNTEFFRRPGLPAMGTNDNGHKGLGGDIYLKNTMQVLTLGVQGVGIGLTNALGGPGRGYADPEGADAYRTANLIAKMYGAVFAECTPVKEGAVLYSYVQDITEKRSSLGTPHWERVYAMLGAGLMAGLPMHIVYQEDLADGWLLEGKIARYPMLFLVGQQQALPPAVQQAIARYQQAGGKVFIDAASADYPGATRLAIDTHTVKDPLKLNHNQDGSWPEVQPAFEKLAAELHALVGQYRRYPLDADEPWVAKTTFDGGAIRYLTVASETSPYPWDAGTAWSLGATFMRSYFPRTVTVTFPSTKGVVYDVFDQRLVTPTVQGQRAHISADLTTFPGRLFAVAPAALSAPRVVATIRDGVMRYTVTALTGTNTVLKAQVPLRVRLLDGQAQIYERFSGTSKAGTFEGEFQLPFGAKRFTLEVTELLGGKGATAQVQVETALPEVFELRADVEIQREAQLRALLQDAKTTGTMTLAVANENILTPEQQQLLQQALLQQGIALQTGVIDANTPAPGQYLAVGYVSTKNTLGVLLTQAQSRGLFDHIMTEYVPGAEHGVVTALFSIRDYRENAIALVGGDAAGLQKTIEAFVRWLGGPAAIAVPKPTANRDVTASGKAATTPATPLLRELTGVKLSNIHASPDGKRLLVTAEGYMNNVALLQDNGAGAEILTAMRIGQGPKVGSAYLSADGQSIGVSARVTQPYGQGFHMVNAANGSMHAFAAFGDFAPRSYHFAASDDGTTVLAPGQFGVVCWRRDGATWREAWAIDYWKNFQQLDWPIHNQDERLPQFHAYIPSGADYALIVFAETTNNGWVVAEHHYGAWVAAVDLATGAERWKFAIPIPDTLLFPELHLSPDGSRMMLQVQKDSFGKETFRYFSLEKDGTMIGAWDAKVAPRSVAVANATGNIAEAFTDRLLEMRSADGTLLFNQLWDGADMISLAFAADGRQLYVSDAAGQLTLLNPDGSTRWRASVGSVSALAVAANRVYAAGWDGRVRAFTEDGHPQWTLDCTPGMRVDDPKAMLLAMPPLPEAAISQATRPSVTSTIVPQGDNLLRTGKATLTTGGTSGWLSAGRNNVKAEELVNGQYDDVNTPWMPLSECDMNARTGRQVWAEITFTAPTDVAALTVYEHTAHPESWPSEGLVQVWNEEMQRWDTALRAIYLHGPITTYPLSLKGVTKLRYAPWNGYFRNFYTSEIEVR